MAFTFSNVSKVACRLITGVGKSSSISASNIVLCNSIKDVNISTRAFTRWFGVNPTKLGGAHGMKCPDELGVVRRPSKLGNTCSCAGLHTDGDKELANFLEKEIKLEKTHQNEEELPQIAGFETSINGSTVKLSKKANSESIVISFNVNHSVEADGSEEEMEADDKGPVMRSYPDFHVEVTKDSQQTLSLRCSFSTDLNDGEEEDIDDQQEDKFIIDEVSVYKDDSTENIYSVGSEVMDGDLYDLLMNMLEERGIDDNFTERLSKFATSVEHSQYIQFLQHLKDIANT